MMILPTGDGHPSIPPSARRLVYLVPILCGLVQILDGYDLATIGLAVPSLAKQWGLAPAAFTQSFALSSVGIMVGALIAGPLGDRFGRRPTLLASVAIFALFSLLTAFAPSLPILVLLRFLTGLGIGGAMPTTVALTADYTPERWRAAIIMFMFCGNTSGTFIAGQVAGWTLPVWGWQAIFIVGGVVPLALLPVLLFLLPEATHFNREARIVAPRGGNPVAGLFRDGLVWTTALLWLIFLLNLLNMYLVSYWLPTVLSLHGLTPADAAFFASVYAAGGVLSTLLLGVMLSRFRAERVLACSISVGVICIALFALVAPTGVALVAVLLGMGGGLVGSQLGLNGFAAAAYPRDLRSTGVGWALGIGRLGGIIGPIVGGLLLSFGFTPIRIMLFAVAPGLITATAITILGWVRARAVDRQAVPAVQESGAPI